MWCFARTQAMPFARTQAMPLVRSTRLSAGALRPWLPRPRHPSSPRRRLGDGGSPADAEEHAHVRGVVLARADSTPVTTDLSGTRMAPLDRAPLRQRIISLVLSTSSQELSPSSPPPAPSPTPRSPRTSTGSTIISRVSNRAVCTHLAELMGQGREGEQPLAGPRRYGEHRHQGMRRGRAEGRAGETARVGA